MSAHSGNPDMSSVLATLLNKFATIESKLDACNAQIANQELQIQGLVRSSGAVESSQRLSNDDDSASVPDEIEDAEVDDSTVDAAQPGALSENARRSVSIVNPPSLPV